MYKFITSILIGDEVSHSRTGVFACMACNITFSRKTISILSEIACQQAASLGNEIYILRYFNLGEQTS